MNADHELGRALINQNGATPSLEQERDVIRGIIARDRRRVQVLKWVTIVAAAIMPISMLFFAVVMITQQPIYAAPAALFGPAFLVTVVAGAGWILLGRSMDTREIQLHLASIEKLLREDRKPDV